MGAGASAQQRGEGAQALLLNAYSKAAVDATGEKPVDEKPAGATDEETADPAAEEEEEEEEDDDDDGIDDEEQERMMKMMQNKQQRGSVSAEAYGEWNKKKEFVAPVHEKSDEQKAAIRQVLGGSFMFNALGEANVTTVVGALQKVEAEAGETMIQQGDDGDFMFIIQEGTLDCYKKHSGEENLVKTCVAGDAFGELALLYNCPRAATVKARDKCLLWKLDRETFSNVVQGAAQARMERMSSFIKMCPVLQAVPMYEQMKLCECLVTEEFKAGDTIITEGEAGDKIYFIESGSVKTSVGGKEGWTHPERDYFGEKSLLSGEPRSATCTAAEDSVVFSADKSAFVNLLGGIKGKLTEQLSRYTA